MTSTEEKKADLITALKEIKPYGTGGKPVAKKIIREHFPLIEEKIDEGCTHAQIQEALKEGMGIKISIDTLRKYIQAIRNENKPQEEEQIEEAQPIKTTRIQAKKRTPRLRERTKETTPDTTSTTEKRRFDRYSPSPDIESEFNL